MFIPAKAEFDLDQISGKVDPVSLKVKKIGLVTTAQYLHELERIKEYLDKKGFGCVIVGQILGCDVKNAEALKEKIDAFLYIGSGVFHPIALLKLGKPVYLLNGDKVDDDPEMKKKLEDLEKKRERLKTRFFSSQNIGIIVSTKPWQKHLAEAEELKRKITSEHPDKKVYVFIGDGVNQMHLDNFPFIESWINTACPRLEEDLDVLNEIPRAFL